MSGEPALAIQHSPDPLDRRISGTPADQGAPAIHRDQNQPACGLLRLVDKGARQRGPNMPGAP